ncbi:tyrosine-type recombinase/integrase [Limnohabitans sp.]|jgi:integrase/recombinase XerD|uniref:tyrosine-type recombinase/integrase n=1 Tax=Limnohabitans sp. TaxID=1907725 RepID=UPI0037BF567D
MAQAKTLTPAEIEQLLSHINTRKYAARNRSMMLLTHWAGLRIGEVAGLRWSDVTTTDGLVKDEIRLLPDMTKGRHARTVFVSAKLTRVRHQIPFSPVFDPSTLTKSST